MLALLQGKSIGGIFLAGIVVGMVLMGAIWYLCR